MANKYDYYITLVDKDPLLSEHIGHHIQNYISHYLNKRVSINIQKSVYDILTMPWAQSVQLCIIEPFDDLKENCFNEETVKSHLAFIKQNEHISFMIYSVFTDPEKRYKDHKIPYYIKWIHHDDLIHDITEIIARKRD